MPAILVVGLVLLVPALLAVDDAAARPDLPPPPPVPECEDLQVLNPRVCLLLGWRYCGDITRPESNRDCVLLLCATGLVAACWF